MSLAVIGPLRHPEGLLSRNEALRSGGKEWGLEDATVAGPSGSQDRRQDHCDLAERNSLLAPGRAFAQLLSGFTARDGSSVDREPPPDPGDRTDSPDSFTEARTRHLLHVHPAETLTPWTCPGTFITETVADAYLLARTRSSSANADGSSSSTDLAAAVHRPTAQVAAATRYAYRQFPAPSTADMTARLRRILIASKFRLPRPDQQTPAEISAIRLAWESPAA